MLSMQLDGSEMLRSSLYQIIFHFLCEIRVLRVCSKYFKQNYEFWAEIAL